MKYLKTFESNIYSVGDYLLLNMPAIEEMNKEHNFVKMPDDNIAKIITIASGYFPYLIETYTTNTFLVRSSEVIRKLTKNEISEYEIKKNAVKYNL